MQTSTETNRVTLEIKNHVLLMGLNRPDKYNAFDMPMFDQLYKAFTELENNSELRCGVLFAHGEHFTSGLDLAKMSSIILKEKRIPRPVNSVDPWNMEAPVRTKPLICVVHGICLTLGIELMLASDITVAAENTRFSQIEVKRGILPFGGATVRFVERAGWGNAMRYLLTGDEFNAQDAIRMNIVQEVVPLGQQLSRALALAETIANNSPLGVYATLESARKAMMEGPQAAFNALPEKVVSLMQTEDAREGIQSFLEKRAAQFKGK